LNKIPTKKLNEESEFEHVADIYGQYMEALKKFPNKSQEEQQEFLVGFGKDMNTLLLVLYEWIHRNDGKEGN